MIKVYGQEVKIGNFPDGTMLLHLTPVATSAKIEWFYENDRELVALIYLVNHLRANGVRSIDLFMPYVPNARQDRVKTTSDVFTLKYFAKIINSLDFNKVIVLDPHSNVSEAVIERIQILSPKNTILKVIDKITEFESETPLLFYPDEGASKRYSGMISQPYAFGIKRRDWETGKIQNLDVIGDIEDIKGKSVLIVDDICSKGGTFYYSAKKLKELGAGDIFLYISHCEKSILDGELINSGLIKKIFTTNSICNFEHELITVMNIA